MSYQMTVGLLVVNQERYAQYRAEIAPLLLAENGSFRYDFVVATTLKSESSHDINRLFVLQFPDRASKERFFSNTQYLEIRSRLYERAVKGTSIVAEYSG